MLLKFSYIPSSKFIQFCNLQNLGYWYIQKHKQWRSQHFRFAIAYVALLLDCDFDRFTYWLHLIGYIFIICHWPYLTADRNFEISILHTSADFLDTKKKPLDYIICRLWCFFHLSERSARMDNLRNDALCRSTGAD